MFYHVRGASPRELPSINISYYLTQGQCQQLHDRGIDGERGRQREVLAQACASDPNQNRAGLHENTGSNLRSRQRDGFIGGLSAILHNLLGKTPL